ncbi:MAG: enoyl-CoA hydratase/isomerase family protein [Deltaproteobacteria bacterium]|nr:enoyl-CoA hydratase/isomerase family protein [Deltaproteobacteria bacterium]
MALVDWTTQRDKGLSQMTLQVDGPPLVSIPLIADLVLSLIEEAKRDDVGAVLLTGPPGKFIIGMDVNEIAALKGTVEVRGATAVVQDLLSDLENAPAVLVCAVDGACLGGGLELVLPFHLLLATPSSTFGFPEIKLGTIPSFGGTQRLARIVGRNRALQVLLQGEPFSAQTALEWGLLAEIVPGEELLPAARKLARSLADLSRPAAQALLRALVSGLDGPMSRGLALEGRLSSRLAGQPDLAEGIRAFLEKRRPVFPSTLAGRPDKKEPD